jgi:hypothetical protein
MPASHHWSYLKPQKVAAKAALVGGRWQGGPSSRADLDVRSVIDVPLV